MIKKHGLFLFLCFISAVIFAGVECRKNALIIAIGDYPQIKDGKHPFTDINSANDVVYLEKTFKKLGFFHSCIRLLADSNATKTGIFSAIDELIMQSNYGDIVHIHISSHGIQMQDDNNDETDGLDEAIVPYDYNMGVYESFIRDDELMALINILRKKVGVSGQVILSMDVPHSGPGASEIIENKSQQLETRGSFFEIDDIEAAAPLIIFSACLDKELGIETTGEDGEPVGAWTYAFYKAILAKEYATFQELQASITGFMKSTVPRQHPVMLGYVNEKPYSFKEVYRKVPKKEVSGDVYVLSIGISNYKSDKASFNNCDNDAMVFSKLIRQQHELYADSNSKIMVYELTNEQATNANILESLNQIISQATPDDYIFFNFAGFSSVLPDSAGKTETCFFPYIDYAIDGEDKDSLHFNDRSDKISLSQLRNLMEFIQAQNQLLITEAGPSSQFRLEFAKSMLETSPAISELSKRNRVIIIPEEVGYDDSPCKDTIYKGGPIGFFLQQACKRVSIFGLFSEEKYIRKRVQRAIESEEVKCDLPFMAGRPYMSFFYEKEFVEELQYFMGDYKLNSRGTEINDWVGKQQVEGLGKAYALVIGCNDYSKGAPDWKNLSNPIEDANAISELLATLYGYEVKKLLNPSADTLISWLKQYSKMLKETDQFVIFIAGHGDYDPFFFDDGFLVLSNSLSKNADPYRRTYLAFSQLANIVDNLPANQILLMVDVCFGGAFDLKISSGQQRSGPDIYEDVSMERMINDKLSLKTRILLSSGSLNTVPDGYMGKHSPFAARLIACLQSKGGDRDVLTSIQLFDFVQRLPSKPIRGELRGNEGGAEFFLIAK